MIDYEAIELFQETKEDLKAFESEIHKFRSEGPLDKISLAKLEEHFKAGHVYNSAAIEGNRLTLQETMLVLKEGIDIRDKPLKESLEVKRLGEAFDYLKVLSESGETIRETDIRELHRLLIGNDPDVGPGEYRKVGVLITGSEHRPPEPLAVPGLVASLVTWINSNKAKDPLIVATVAHHELTAIHPFKDGNGRVSRLLMNLILLQHGYPICNIRHERRPTYYESLSFADVGIYDPLTRLIKESCAELFAEYVRIRTETKRTQEWAAKWGVKEAEIGLRRETRELELWQSRIKQIFLEFQNSTELLDDKLEKITLGFYDFRNEIDLDKYQKLVDKGFVERANAFSITITDSRTLPNRDERFMFRYCRPVDFHPRKVITLELNHLDKDEKKYIRLGESECHDRIHLRYLYINSDGNIIARINDPSKGFEIDIAANPISQVVTAFFDDVLKNVIKLS